MAGAEKLWFQEGNMSRHHCTMVSQERILKNNNREAFFNLINAEPILNQAQETSPIVNL